MKAQFDITFFIKVAVFAAACVASFALFAQEKGKADVVGKDVVVEKQVDVKTNAVDAAKAPLTQEQIDELKSSYKAMTDEDIAAKEAEFARKRYEEAMKNGAGREKYHGKCVAEIQRSDGTNGVEYVYADGFTYFIAAQKRPSKYQGVGNPNSKAQQKREAKLPARLAELKRRRAEITSTTNTVEMIQYSNGTTELRFSDGRKELINDRR